jgi:hypothetical protein
MIAVLTAATIAKPHAICCGNLILEAYDAYHFHCLLFAMLWISAAYCQTPPVSTTTGPHTVQGVNCALTVNSYDGAYFTDGTHSGYRFWQSDGAEFSFRVTNLNKTVSYAYLYFGDGTGQLINQNTSYSHSVGKNSDFVPSLVVVYTDSTSEEVLGPCMYEIFLSTEVYSPRPSSFSPPMTQYGIVNTYLSNNSHTLAANFLICSCGVKTDNCGGWHSDEYDVTNDPSDCKTPDGVCAPSC